MRRSWRLRPASSATAEAGGPTPCNAVHIRPVRCKLRTTLEQLCYAGEAADTVSTLLRTRGDAKTHM
jgi:hypothetical protein